MFDSQNSKARARRTQPEAVLSWIQGQTGIVHPDVYGLALVFVKYSLVEGLALGDLTAPAVQDVDGQIGTRDAVLKLQGKINIHVIAVLNDSAGGVRGDARGVHRDVGELSVTASRFDDAVVASGEQLVVALDDTGTVIAGHSHHAVFHEHRSSADEGNAGHVVRDEHHGGTLDQLANTPVALVAKAQVADGEDFIEEQNVRFK